MERICKTYITEFGDTPPMTTEDWNLMISLSKSLCRILMFEEKKKEKAKPTGVAPKRDLASLP